MSQFAGLLKREWLEHRTAFLWGPGVVLVVVLLAGLMTVLANLGGEVSVTIEQQHTSTDLTNELALPEADDELGAMEILAAMTLDVAGSTDAELRRKMALLQFGVAQPFHLIFIALAVFALLASLYDERKDSSILFWKSMPVSDVSTVASKLVFVVWLAPLVSIGAIVVAQFLTLSLVAVYVEDGMAGRVWAASQFWWQPVKLLWAYLQLGIWLLPFASWIMLVSAAANKLPALWAIAIPWVLVLLERIVFGSNVIAEAINTQLQAWKLLSSSGAASEAGPAALLSLQLWGGVVIAVVFLAGAVFLRRRNNEI